MRHNFILRPCGVFDGITTTLKVTGDEWTHIIRVGQRFGVSAHLETEPVFDAGQVKDVVDGLTRAIGYAPAPASKKKVAVKAGASKPNYPQCIEHEPHPTAQTTAPLSPDEDDAVDKVLLFLLQYCVKGLTVRRTHGY